MWNDTHKKTLARSSALKCDKYRCDKMVSQNCKRGRRGADWQIDKGLGTLDLLDRILDSLEVGLSGCDTRLHFFSETPKFNFRSSKFNFRSTETAKLELEPFLLSDLADR